jgi:hypothetical protein
MLTPITVRLFSDLDGTGVYPYQYTEMIEGVDHDGFIENGMCMFRIDLSEFIITDMKK